MSFHTIGFGFQNTSTNHFPAFTSLPLPAFNDSFFSLAKPSQTGATNAFLLPVEMKVIMAFAISQSLIQAQINAPSLQRVFLPLIRPIQTGLVPPNDPNVSSGFIAENHIPEGEPVGVDALVGGTLQSPLAFLWFAHKQITPIPAGDAFWVPYFIDEPDLGEGSGVSLIPFQWNQLKIGFFRYRPEKSWFCSSGLTMTVIS